MSEKINKFDDVKKALLERKIELEENLASLSKEKITDDQVKDNGDEALASTMEVLKMSFQDSERNEFEHIVQALAKIENGTYGLCADCGEPISEKRLTMNPNVSRCLVCQEAFEDNADLMNL